MQTFSLYFAPEVLTFSKRNYTWKKYIRYKYFVLENYIKYSSYDSKESEIPNDVLIIFSNTQRKLMALYKFKQMCLNKNKKFLSEQIDLNFNPLDDIPEKYKIIVIQNGIKNQFSLFDLIKIINTALSYESHFFPEPKAPKNPWSNKIFNDSTLYNIYFKIIQSRISMPILFFRYFQSNFCLKTYERHNQLIIKKYIIENCHMLSDSKKIYYINVLQTFFNNRSKAIKISIDSSFPKKRLIEVMGEFIKPYLLALYSYESDLRILYRTQFMRKMKKFVNENPYFGRKFVSTQIIKIFYLSNIIYTDNNPVLIDPDIYVPKPNMISLSDKCFFVDLIENKKYTIFPSFDMSIKSIIPIKKFKYDLLNIIRKFNFSPLYTSIIDKKYKPIVDQILNITRDASGNIISKKYTRIIDNVDDNDESSDDSSDVTSDEINNENNDESVDESVDENDDESRHEPITDNQLEELIINAAVANGLFSSVTDSTVDNDNMDTEEEEDLHEINISFNDNNGDDDITIDNNSDDDNSNAESEGTI